MERRKIYNVAMKVLMLLCVGVTAGITLFLVAYVLIRGVPGLSWAFLSRKPSYTAGTVGILPDILNTVYILLTTLLLVLPLGVGAAVYLTEYAGTSRASKVIAYGAEILSGIPSIIYGLVGMLIFCQKMKMGTCLMAGALTLTVMNLPTMMRTAQESLITVPQSYREGAFGLGAGKWRVIRTVVLPGCVDGVLTGCILCAGRILGESAALMFTAGTAHAVNNIVSGLGSSGATLTVALYLYAKEQGEFQAAYAIAVILLTLSALFNLSADYLGKYFRKKREG